MNQSIPTYQPLKKETVDPVARSIAKPDAFAKPCTIGNQKSVRVRVSQGDKSLKPRRKKKNHDKRDVHFY